MRPPGVTRFGAVEAAVVLAAFVLRAGYVLGTRHMPVHGDPADYNRLAVNIAHGHGFGPSSLPAGGPTALRPPLYPYVLGAVYRATGDSVTAGRLVGAAFGALAVALMILLAGSIWDRRVGVLAGLLAAGYPAFVQINSALLSETVFLPLFIGSLLAVARYRGTHHPGWMVAAGVLAGLAVLARPVAVVLLAAMATQLVRRPFYRREAAVLAAGAVALVVTVAPWTIRNAVVLHAVVPVTDYAGFDLFGTYNDQTQHARQLPTAWRPNLSDPRFVELVNDRALSELQVSNRLDSLARSYVRAHPLSVLRTAAYGTVRMADLTGVGWAQQSYAAVGLGRWSSWAGAAGWYVLALLGLAGLWLPQRRRLSWVFWATPVLAWFGTVVVLADDRYREPVEVFAVLLAALTLERIVARLRPKPASAP